MRQLLKIMNYAAQLLALIDIRKQISEQLASKKSNQQHKKKETQPTDFSAIALSSSDPYRPFFSTVYYRNFHNNKLFISHLQHS